MAVYEHGTQDSLYEMDQPIELSPTLAPNAFISVSDDRCDDKTFTVKSDQLLPKENEGSRLSFKETIVSKLYSKTHPKAAFKLNLM